MVHQDVSLHSRRLGWETPLHFSHPTYIDTHYGQVSPRPWGCCAGLEQLEGESPGQPLGLLHEDLDLWQLEGATGRTGLSSWGL